MIAIAIQLKHLEDLLRCNSHLKIGFIDDTNILEIKSSYNIILTLEFDNNNLEDNAEIIYNRITNLENITLYIPKIYIPS